MKKRNSMTIIKQIVHDNFKDDYYSKLRYSLKTAHLF